MYMNIMNMETCEAGNEPYVALPKEVSTWTCTGPKCQGTKDRSDIEWRVSGGTYVGLTASVITVTTGSPTTPGTEDVVMDYRVLLSWTQDDPGTYDYTDLQYTLSAL